MILSVISFALGTVAYTISQMSQHGKLRWGFNNPDSFHHPGSWRNKYKMPLQEAPNNFYYRFFKVVHKEKFPGSATIFVSATDSYHLFQFLFKLFLILSLVTYEPIFNLKVWDFIVYFVGFGVVFSLTYKLASK